MTDLEQELSAVVDATVRAVLDQYYADLEQACEAALQDGRYGVLIDRNRNICRPDSRVLYGRIYDVTACGEERVQEW